MEDIDAGAEQTVTFGLDGRDYEIDVSNQDAERLRATLAPYVSAARRVGGRSLHAVGRTLRNDLARTERVRQ